MTSAAWEPGQTHLPPEPCDPPTKPPLKPSDSAQSVRPPSAATQSYRLDFDIGPCTEAERDAFLDAIFDLPEWVVVGGGGIGIKEIPDNE